MTDTVAPICCFLGHVDVGKTSLLDHLRHSDVQRHEVGRITQQIGSTYINRGVLDEITEGLSKNLEIPGLLVVDTPGHDCFTQMRLVGIKVSHLPIVVVDMVKGLEKQTKQCIGLLNKRQIPFIMALNKLDRVPGWKVSGHRNLKKAFQAQSRDTMREIKDASNRIICQMAELGMNSALYYENTDPRDTISMVPVSAKTGEGMADLMILISKLTTRNLTTARAMPASLYGEAFGYVMETKQDERHGLVVYALLVANELRKGDELVVETIEGGTAKATVRELLTPPDQKEMKNKISLAVRDVVRGTSGVAIKFTDDAVYDQMAPGGLLLRYNSGVDYERKRDRILAEVRRDTERETDDIKLDKVGIIINVPARSMAYAVLKLIQDGGHGAMVQEINVGKLNKTLIIKASGQLPRERGSDRIYQKRFAVILDYNNLYGDEVEYDEEIREMAKKSDVTIISGNIVHHLVERYHRFVAGLDDELRTMFPGATSEFSLEILPRFVFLKKTPLLFGVRVTSGRLVPKMGIKATKGEGRDYTEVRLGTLQEIQRDRKMIESASRTDEVCIRIVNDESREYGKHFDETWTLVPDFTPEELTARAKYPEVFTA